MTAFDIMVDYDDVVFPWSDIMHEWSGKHGLHDGTGTWKSWTPWVDYGCSKAEWLDAVGAATLAGVYADTPPMPGSVEALRRLYIAGHRLHIVTARGFVMEGGPDNTAQIREWTYQHVWEFAVPYHTLTFSKDKAGAQQELGVNFDFAIDDGVHNYEALDEAGVPVYILTRPHNADFPAERRVNTVDEFADMILEAAQ